MKTDGTLNTSIGEVRASDLLIQGDWLFYIDPANRNRLYKMRTDGSEIVRVMDVECRSFNISGNWIYYIFAGNGNICKVKTNGTGAATVVADKSDALNLAGNWLYYTDLNDAGAIYKIKTDGSGRTKLNVEKSAAINIAGRWLYFKPQPTAAAAAAGTPDSFYRMRLDGSSLTQVQDVLIAQMPTAPMIITPAPKTFPPPDPTEAPVDYSGTDYYYIWTPPAVNPTPPPASQPITPTPYAAPTPPAELWSGMSLAGLHLGDSYDQIIALYGTPDSKFSMIATGGSYMNLTYLNRGVEILMDMNMTRIKRIKTVSPNRDDFLAIGIRLGSSIQEAIQNLKGRYTFMKLYEGLVSGTKHYRFYAQYANSGYLEIMSNPSDAQTISYIQIMTFDIGFPLSVTN
jgi:hypothetical protein